MTEDTPMAYDLKPLKAPRAAGNLLRLLAPLLEKPPLRGLLSRIQLSSAGIQAFRSVEAEGAIPFQPPSASRGGRGVAGKLDPMAVAAEVAAAAANRPDGFAFETAADFVSAYREGRTNPVEVATRVLQSIKETERLDPPLRIFIAQDENDLLSQAEASAERYRQGKPLGPLDGVPVAVKDELDQRGYPTTVGTRFLGSRPAREDAEAVARLRSSGALLLGKANMHEMGIGVTGINPHFGPARNPYDPRRITGGSSSGPAAAVAAGLCPVAVGADGGGSIRIPAALCGVVGLKPTFGRVSEYGAAPLCWSVAHVGPLASTVPDAALAYALMAGPDPKDPNSLIQPLPQLEGLGQSDLSGVRLGVYPPWFEDAEAGVVSACRKVLSGLEQAGCVLREIELPELSLLRTVHLVVIVSEMAAAHLAYYQEHRKDYAYETRVNLALARHLKAADYLHAQRHRLRLCGHFTRALEQVDAIVTPATGCTAPVIPRDALKTGETNLALTDRIMRFSPAANLTGLPALSVPAGYDDHGLPVGLQLIGRAWEEHRLLRIAAVAENLTPRRPPKVHRRLLPMTA